jgi:hypothetical protein
MATIEWCSVSIDSNIVLFVQLFPLVYDIASIVGMLLFMSGDVELNPGPCKICPKCESMVPNRTINCKCGYKFRKCSNQKNVNETKHISMILRRASESKTDKLLRNESNRLAMSKKKIT